MSDRKQYQREYHASNTDKAANRKQDERDRKERLRSYWYARLVLKREMPALLAGCTPEQIEAARVEYIGVLAETV